MRLILLSLVLLCIIPSVLATEQVQGIMPDSPLYSLDVILDNVVLAFNPGRAEKILLERQGELIMMKEKGNIEKTKVPAYQMQKIIEKHKERISVVGLENAQLRLNEVKQKFIEKGKAVPEGIDKALNVTLRNIAKKRMGET